MSHRASRAPKVEFSRGLGVAGGLSGSAAPINDEPVSSNEGRRGALLPNEPVLAFDAVYLDIHRNRYRYRIAPPKGLQSLQFMQALEP